MVFSLHKNEEPFFLIQVISLDDLYWDCCMKKLWWAECFWWPVFSKSDS